MKCPYANFDCPYVNTSAMTKDVNCEECDHYDPDGVRLSPGCLSKIGIFIMLLLLSLLVKGQDNIQVTPREKKVLSEPAKVIMLYSSSILLDAAGDALNDSGHKDWGHLCNTGSVGILLVSPFLINYEKKKWGWYIASYVGLRIGMFDYTYNAVRGLPLETIGTTSNWDKGLQALNPPNTRFGRVVFFTFGFFVPINMLKQ